MKKVYSIENLCCANCAAKIEEKLKQLPEVEDLTLTFATMKLSVTAKNPDKLLPKLTEIARSVEDGVTFTPIKDHHEHDHSNEDGKVILLGSGLFVLGLILGAVDFAMAQKVAFVAAYLVLGWEILVTAGKNLVKGKMLDENFLMGIATLGAFAINEFPEAVGVMLFYRVGEWFEEKALERSRSQIMEAVDLRPETVLLDNGMAIPAEDAEVGDLLLVRPGDRIPLDAVVVKGESRIDTAPITGEPVPVSVKPGERVISGCVNINGRLIIQVEKALADSMVTRILDSVENAAANKPRFEKFITRFARIYTPIVVGLAAFVAVVPSVVTGDWNYWVYTALSFLVMSCPCALVLSVPLAFFSGIGVGGKKGILFKGGMAMEALGRIRGVVMDKTGTLTRGDFRVQEIQGEVLALAASCEQDSTHPIGISILEAAREQALILEKPEHLEEIAGQGIHARLGGREILCGNEKLLAGIVIPERTAVGTRVLVAVDGSYCGQLIIADTVKENAKSAVSKLKKLGLSTAILTGDGEDTARAVAKETGVEEVHAKLLPEEKLSVLNSIRSRLGPVMFVGDGINDAPVLAGADVGAAMGSGADAAIEAADVVFMTSDPAAIPKAVEIARQTARIAWQNVIFALAVKLLVMVLGLGGHASMWMAVFADSGVAMLCVLNSIRMLYKK